MMTRGTSRVARFTTAGRLFSAVKGAAAESEKFPVMGVRWRSSLTLGEKEQVNNKNGEDKQVVASYWGIKGEEVKKEDGTPWKWNCFRPWETYQADLTIDLKKHHVPTTFLDKLAYWTVKSLRFPTDVFFQVLLLVPFNP